MYHILHGAGSGRLAGRRVFLYASDYPHHKRLIDSSMRQFFRKTIALPQDHGAWVFILSPLLIGILAGGPVNAASVSVCVAAMAAFLLRQPVTVMVKAYSGRRPRTDLPAARFWFCVYGAIALLALAELLLLDNGYILYLAVPGIPVFAWHLRLVSRRSERRAVNVEIIATGVLSLAAPAAYWAGLGRYEPPGWWLWLLTWLQSSASIVYAYLRLEQRELDSQPDSKVLWSMGGRALLYTSFNFTLTLALGALRILPTFIFIPFLLQFLETLWGITQPAIRLRPTAIGLRQLAVSTLWTILFILFWPRPV